jgi:hypothetical protein
MTASYWFRVYAPRASNEGRRLDVETDTSAWRCLDVAAASRLPGFPVAACSTNAASGCKAQHVRGSSVAAMHPPVAAQSTASLRRDSIFFVAMFIDSASFLSAHARLRWLAVGVASLSSRLGPMDERNDSLQQKDRGA